MSAFLYIGGAAGVIGGMVALFFALRKGGRAVEETTQAAATDAWDLGPVLKPEAHTPIADISGLWCKACGGIWPCLTAVEYRSDYAEGAGPHRPMPGYDGEVMP